MNQAEITEDVIEDDEVVDQNTTEQENEVTEDVQEASKVEETPVETEEEVVSIEGETPSPEDVVENEQTAPKWVKEVRAKNRQLQNELRELRKLQGTSVQTQESPSVGEKPTLEKCEYDADVFEAKYSQWLDAKRKVEAEADSRKKQEEQKQAEWNDRLNHYKKLKSELKVSDFDDAENAVVEQMSESQQAIIIKGGTNVAALIYAIGKNSKILKELSSIQDPVQFAFAVAKLETKVKIAQRKVTTTPEKAVRASSGTPSAAPAGKQLERLQAEAEKTGDFTQVMAFKRQQKRKV